MQQRWAALLAAGAVAVRVFLEMAVPELPGQGRARWQTPWEPPAAVEESAVPTPKEARDEPGPLPASEPESAPVPDMQPPAPAPEAAEELLSVPVLDQTSLAPDLEALAAEPLTQTLPGEGAQILIIHTHGTEAYMPVPGEEYEASDPYRTTDPAHSVIRVGDVLCAALERQGLRVIHDRSLYDYPSYTGSYARSQAAAEEWLARCPGVAVIIDLHRDGVDPAQTETSGDGPASLLLVVGTGENGLEHPLWRENLKLAMAMERELLAEGEGQILPVRLVRERYNQQLSTGTFILEVGSNADALSQAEQAAELFARAVGPLFLSLVAED